MIGRFFLIVSLTQAAAAASDKRSLVIIVIALCLIAILAALRPASWKFIGTPAQSQGADPTVAPMSRARLLSVYAAIALIVGGSLLDCVRDTEHWPWSNYPMYSQVDESRIFSDLRIYGVPQNNLGTEVSLCTDPRFLQPFDPVRLSQALGIAMGKPGMRQGLLDILAQYEALRKAHRHSGPALIGLRCYRVYWKLDAEGTTIEKPARKDLILEVFSPAGKAS